MISRLILFLSPNRSLKCARITIHMNLFASFAANNSLWLLWYSVVLNEPEVIQQNKVRPRMFTYIYHLFKRIMGNTFYPEFACWLMYGCVKIYLKKIHKITLNYNIYNLNYVLYYPRDIRYKYNCIKNSHIYVYNLWISRMLNKSFLWQSKCKFYDFLISCSHWTLPKVGFDAIQVDK